MDIVEYISLNRYHRIDLKKYISKNISQTVIIQPLFGVTRWDHIFYILIYDDYPPSTRINPFHQIGLFRRLQYTTIRNCPCRLGINRLIYREYSHRSIRPTTIYYSGASRFC